MTTLTPEELDSIPAHLAGEVLSCLAALKTVDFNPEDYREDAAGFIEEVLGETLTDDLRAICDSVVRNEVTIAQSGNGTGKSYIEGRLAIWFFVCHKEAQVYCAAAPPQTNLENILWAEISTVADAHSALLDDCDIKQLKITRKPLEFITGVAIPTAGNNATKQARFSGKHAPSLLFLVDEGDAVPDPVFDGIETCLSGGLTRLLVTFNPRQRMGKVYRTIKSGQASVIKLSAFNHPNVITGENIIPGAVDRAKTVRRVAQWTRPLVDGEAKDKGCYELPDFLVGCRPVDQKGVMGPSLVAGWYKIIEHAFSHVVLGEYPAQSDNQLISEEWVDKAVERYELFTKTHGVIVPETIKARCGLDVADMGKDSSVLTKRFGNFVHPQVSWQKQDVIEVGDLVKHNLDDSGITNISSINVDGTGVGIGVAPYITRKYSLPGVKVMVASASTETTELGEFGLLLDQLMWSVREWFRTEKAMLPNDKGLIEELLAYQYKIVNGKIKVSSTDDIKDLLKRSPDQSRSLMLTFASTGAFGAADLS